ncbi:hypothetical protein P0082_12115 [Candidatus Haliotispira prima]|uniref:Uncharacterized protein n=1 Tax=Candidatus Haliotispira prima TaxID=3034016 RepID=A0ABY8MK66_9SPIO|nr:hypothetical protein P0082_12115 [Candidatus Haliotispira prima]
MKRFPDGMQILSLIGLLIIFSEFTALPLQARDQGPETTGTFSLLPRPPDTAVEIPGQRLERLSRQWLEDIRALAQTSERPGNLREASDQETAIFRAIEQFASHYGFTSKFYPLDQIKTMHSFSGNLEIRIPARLQNDRAANLLTERNLSEELWRQVYQSGREVIFLTPISGASSLDIVTMLLFITISSQQPPPLPVRIVFLGSELLPTELSQFLYNSRIGNLPANLVRSSVNYPVDYPRDYPKGSRSFLYNYRLPLPYGLLYFYHRQEALSASPSFGRILRELALHSVKVLRELSQYLSYSGPAVSGQDPPLFPPTPFDLGPDSLYQIIYNGSRSLTPARDARQLAQALQLAQIPFQFGNGLKLSSALQRDLALLPLDPYIERQWPIAAIYQENPVDLPPEQEAIQLSRLTLGLDWFLGLKLEQAIEEQRQITTDKLQGKERAVLPRPGGRHYWLWSMPGTDLSLKQYYISERQILWLVFIALAVFALSGLGAHSRLRELHVLHRIKKSTATLNILSIFILIAGYTLFANEALWFVFKLAGLALPGNGANGSHWSGQGFIYSNNLALAVFILLKINFALLFLYSGALALNLEVRLEIQVLPYVSQCLALAMMFLLLWQNLSLVVPGLYLFFLSSLYAAMPKYRRRNTLYRLLQNILQYSIIFLLFLPYFLLVFLLSVPSNSADPQSSVPTLLSSRNPYYYALTLLLFSPGLFLHFTRVQFHRLHYPKRYRHYLLSRITFYAGSIVFCFAIIYLVRRQSASSGNLRNVVEWTSEDGAEQTGLVSPLPALRLEELYVLPESRDAGVEQSRLDDMGLKVSRLYFADNSSGNFLGKLSFAGLASDGSSPLMQRAGQQIEMKEPGLSSIADDGQTRLLRERELRKEELEALQQFGRELWRAENTRTGQHYSGILELQTAGRLNYIVADVRARNLETLFTNFPFSVPAPLSQLSEVVPFQGVSSQEALPQDRSRLVMGFYPPRDLRIELLLAHKPQEYELSYSIEFQVSDFGRQAALHQQKDPVALHLFPLLSKLRLAGDVYVAETSLKDKGKNNRDGADTHMELEPWKDFLHIVHIRGLRKPLLFP